MPPLLNGPPTRPRRSTISAAISRVSIAARTNSAFQAQEKILSRSMWYRRKWRERSKRAPGNELGAKAWQAQQSQKLSSKLTPAEVAAELPPATAGVPAREAAHPVRELFRSAPT